MCTEQNVTVGDPERDGRRRRPRTISKTIPHVPLLVELSLHHGVRLKGVFIEQDSKVCIACAHKELLRDVWDLITGFLKNNCMVRTTCSGDNVSRISARRAWIPLEEGKAKLMMHEITVRCINLTVPIRFGLTKVHQRKNEGSRFRKRASPCTRICIDRIVGSRKGGTCTSLVCSS